MAIKNKDGTTFKLQGPNPLVLNQDFWEGKVRFHNFGWETAITKEGAALEREEEPMPDFIELKDIKTEEIKVQAKEIIPDPKRKKKPPDLTEGLPRIPMYCLPAIISETYDALYDETRVSLHYGQQFAFEGIIASFTDMTFQVWSNITDAKPHSIIFVPKDRRWWRIDKAEPKAEGLLLSCVPSETHPSFST